MRSLQALFVVVSVAAISGGATCPRASMRLPITPPTPTLFTMPDRPICDGAYDAAVDVALVADLGLKEVSGFAQGVANEGVAWAVADAGNAASVYGVSTTTGETRLVVELPVDNVDFEDIAVGPCPDLAGPCVYVADTGDNDLSRDHVVVYAFPEPVVADDAAAGTTALDAVWILPMKFPNDESVDVEAVAVLPDASAILLFEKTLGTEARIFAAKAPWTLAVDDETPPAVLENSGTVDTGSGDDDLITGASAHWSGKRLLLRTKTQIVEFTADGPAGFLDLSSSTPRQELPSPDGEGGRGEAVSYAANGVDVVTVAEADLDAVPVLHKSACP